MKVVVFGLGLIGGSLGLVLRERRPDLHIVGVDRADVLRHAHAAHAAHVLIPVEKRAEVESSLACDVVVLAAPVSVIIQEISGTLDRAQVVIDCGSTKRAVSEVVRAHPRRSHFVPSHPMAGDPHGGIENARVDLFENRRWIICPEQSETSALETAREIITATGAEIVALDAVTHDRAVARTSHVPQLMASALSVIAARGTPHAAMGPAFESATRVAGGPEGIWRDIFATNADEIAAALGEFMGELERVRVGLSATPLDVEPARALLSGARGLRGPRH